MRDSEGVRHENMLGRIGLTELFQNSTLLYFYKLYASLQLLYSLTVVPSYP